jgi:transcriptional regulator GlxA family with amidase domain
MTLKGLTQEGPLQKRTVGNSKKKGAQMLTETPHSIGQRIGSEPGTTRHDSPVALHSVATQDGSTTPYAVLVKLLKSARQALDGDDKEARQFIITAADLINAEVARLDASEHPEQFHTGNRHLAPWQTRRLSEFIEENLVEKIRISELAQLARLSGRQLSRAFTSDFGEAPYAYIVRRRIERAKEMMLLTEESLAYIAVACGLSDQPHLTRLFHRIVGESPAGWRRRHRSPDV